MSLEAATRRVKERAAQLGFASCGVTDLRPPPHGDRLRQWLADGHAAGMSYMHRQASRRLEPERIFPGAQRAVVVTRNYFHPDPPPAGPGSGTVAKYARGPDYHDALRPALEDLERCVREVGGSETVARSYVDAGPVPERELAQRAGLGWIGKNTMLIDPRHGSFFFIGTVLTNLELTVDPAFEADRCGTCRRCLDACPTDAFPEERVLDSRRCISYLTIEHRGELPPGMDDGLAGWIFGCDICQDVCPWNVRFASPDPDPLPHDPTLAELDLEELATVGRDEFDRRFGHTPLERPGVDGMRRNARAVLRVQDNAWRTK